MNNKVNTFETTGYANLIGTVVMLWMKSNFKDSLKMKNVSNIKTKNPDISIRIFFCSPSWARTKDPLINSQML